MDLGHFWHRERFGIRICVAHQSSSSQPRDLGIETVCNQQRANNAFTYFLVNLTFPNQGDLRSMFPYTKCGRRTPDGTNVFEGIVMDGTIMGILRKLPNYERIRSQFVLTGTYPIDST